MNATSIFGIEQMGPTVVVTPQLDPDELTFDERAEAEIGDVLSQLGVGTATNVVVDCHRINRCCSSAVAFFIKLTKNAQRHGGSLVFCNLSKHLRELFETLNLNTFWVTCTSREEAIAEVERPKDKE